MPHWPPQNKKQPRPKVIPRLKAELDQEDTKAVGKKEDLSPVEVPEEVQGWKKSFEELNLTIF